MQLFLGDCLKKLKELPDCSVDAVVCDPPYGLSFMGKKWDYDVPTVEVWVECLRVLKPGGHLLAFAGTQTQHRMAVRIEDAGFEIRDMIAWVYGSGFPKSLDVSKAIDKAAGAKRDVVGVNENSRPSKRKGGAGFDATVGSEVLGDMLITAPATPEAQQWDGFGTALKPSLEPITMARKPLEGTVAANVLAHGTGGINVDGCRVGTEERYNPAAGNKANGNSLNMSKIGMPQDAEGQNALGRWPSNLIHDGSDEVVELFPQTVGKTGSAARFFYTTKVSKSERGQGSNHPTVKPIALMRYLCRLVTPPGGTVLDPYMGSGTTGKAALLEGFDFIGIEREPNYFAIAEARVNNSPIPLNEDESTAERGLSQGSIFDLI
jgi:site-specific DNA-methyltransferase (adenine-specific)